VLHDVEGWIFGRRCRHWHPHLMFLVPLAEPAAWGADVPGSPIIAAKDEQDRLTVFLIPLSKWSDGSTAPPIEN
jgi:hypothetical protein